MRAIAPTVYMLIGMIRIAMAEFAAMVLTAVITIQMTETAVFITKDKDI